MDGFGLLVILVIILGIVFSGIFIVQQQRVAIIERLGKYHRTVGAGIHIKIPLVDRIVSKQSLRVFQLDNVISTKTKDNVFVLVKVSVQYRIDPTKVETAFYELTNPAQQIQSYIEDALRSAVPTLILDESFERKDDIAQSVQQTVSEEMGRFGFIILKTLITELDPDEKVRTSMNEINAAQRQRTAAQELAEADRIKVVTAAKAEAEKAQLTGEGLANQRKAIVNGLTESFEELKNSGLNEEQVLSLLIANQWIDAMDRFAVKGNSAIFLPNDAQGANVMRSQILQGMLSTRAVNLGEDK